MDRWINIDSPEYIPDPHPLSHSPQGGVRGEVRGGVIICIIYYLFFKNKHLYIKIEPKLPFIQN